MMKEYIRKNPWLGLESYKEGEVLYGRDEDIRDLTQCVLNDVDTLLYGKSGIGKSSILNAGIIPAARRHGFLPIMVRLSHKEQQFSYLQQIKYAVEQNILQVVADLSKGIREVVACKDEKEETIYEYFHRHTFHNERGERIKLLIIFDQFEEIFTLQSSEVKKKRFFAELADFLNDIMPDKLQHEVVALSNTQEEIKTLDEGNFKDLFDDLKLGTEIGSPEYVYDNDIHLVFTIREDFLSEFEHYTASIPSLKQNRYGLRPITDEQAAQIILRPVPGLINESVAKLIIENVTGRKDFSLNGVPEIEVDSAVLSLYLNRLYDAKEEHQITIELIEEKGSEIIADFYQDAISNISESTVEYLEDMLLNGKGRRDNITMYDAMNDGHATEEELDILCNKKKILRQFNYAGDLRIEYVHDILCPVVQNHREERILLRQQEEEFRKQEEEHEAIVKKQKEEMEEMARRVAVQKRRNRIRLGIVLALLLLSVSATAVYYFFFEMEFKASYASYTTINGWPIGIGKKLGDDDKKNMPIYYQLIRKGFYSKNTRVNVLNNQKELTRNKFSESPLVGLYETEGSDERAKIFANIQRQVAYWIYSPDNDKKNLLRKTAYDMNGEELYTIQYFRSSTQSAEDSVNLSKEKLLWANYLDKDGKSLQIRDNGADRVRIRVDDHGRYTGYQFYSETGTPQPNHEGVYGYRYVLGEDGRILQKQYVDEFGDPISYRNLSYKAFDEYGRWTVSTFGKAKYSKDLVVFTMKNRTDSLIFGEHGDLKYRSETLSGENNMYHYTRGKIFKCSRYRNGILKYCRQDLPQNDNNVSEIRVFWADSLIPYRIKREEKRSGKNTIAYYGGKDSIHINEPLMITPRGNYHKLVTDTIQEGNLIRISKQYLDNKEELSSQYYQNQQVFYINEKGETVKSILYHNNMIDKATIYEYEDGQLIAQSVMGIEGTPIRYPKWDERHLCYYKLKQVRNFSNTIVAVKALNEFGDESLITFDNMRYYIGILPSKEIWVNDENSTVYGSQVYITSIMPITDNNQVEYIHIINRTGEWYKAGVRDGDLLLSEGKDIKVARANIEKNTYDIISFTPGEGESGAEHYVIYFNRREMDRYHQAIRNLNHE